MVEEGLSRYGSGDLDGALAVWEDALALDPDNAQANSYVDYVRTNYDVLQTGAGMGVTEDGVPFGIEEEPEYIIEVTPGQEVTASSPPPMFMDPLDEGWFIEEESRQVLSARTRSGAVAPPGPPELADVATQHELDRARRRDSLQLVELEADEPPEHERSRGGSELTFDSAPHAYGEEHRGGTTDDFGEEPGSFNREVTPLGFGNIETEIKKRELGFVQPAQGPARLEVRLRTPSTPPPAVASPPTVAVGDENFPNTDLFSTAQGIPIMTRPPAPTTPPPISEAELLASLPSPRRITPVRGSMTNEARGPMREVPENKRPPAERDRAETTRGEEIDAIALTSAPTRDLGDRFVSALAARRRGPMDDAAGRRRDGGSNDEFSVSEPTRDIGLRPDGAPASRKLPTLKQQVPAVGEGTRIDVILPFDPIDARSASILEEVDVDEPPNEAKEDRTRRRISGLIARAAAWSGQQELDKAAAAVDLALSEDPNSALAQKLIHRNREAIMAIFQSFLGDLERRPQLTRPLHELSNAPISPRAAFLLSRIDGMLTIDEILDVSGMPRLEAYRHLTQLFLRGILR